jgi:hypothetical protein
MAIIKYLAALLGLLILVGVDVHLYEIGKDAAAEGLLWAVGVYAIGFLFFVAISDRDGEI